MKYERSELFSDTLHNTAPAEITIRLPHRQVVLVEIFNIDSAKDFAFQVAKYGASFLLIEFVRIRPRNAPTIYY